MPASLPVLELVSVSVVLSLSEVVLPPTSPVELSCSWSVAVPVSVSFSV